MGTSRGIIPKRAGPLLQENMEPGKSEVGNEDTLGRDTSLPARCPSGLAASMKLQSEGWRNKLSQTLPRGTIYGRCLSPALPRYARSAGGTSTVSGSGDYKYVGQASVYRKGTPSVPRS